MQDGDISNETLPAIYIVFEGTLGLFRDEKSGQRYDRFVSRRKWNKAANEFRVNGHMKDEMWRIASSNLVNLRLISFLPLSMAAYLVLLTESWSIPPCDLELFADPADLAHELMSPYRQHVMYVCHADTRTRFTYGGKGLQIDPMNPRLLGGS